MLSEKLTSYLKNNNWWYDSPIEMYIEPLKELNIEESSDIITFFKHSGQGAPTFSGKRYELYHLGWFILYGDYLDMLPIVRKNLGLGDNYFPLDSFEGEGGFFYDKDTKTVIELELGEILINFQNGKIDKQWSSFTSFMEWYFDIES